MIYVGKLRKIKKLKICTLKIRTVDGGVPPLLEIIIQIKIFERKIFIFQNFSIFFDENGL